MFMFVRVSADRFLLLAARGMPEEDVPSCSLSLIKGNSTKTRK